MKISQKKAKELMNREDVVVLDVREIEEYNQEHIKNAVLIPVHELIYKAKKMLPDKNKTILIYCQSGIRSAEAARTLEFMGYKNVYDFGGIDTWPYGTVR